MSTEKHDPWALLREARKFVVDAERLWIEWDNEQEERAVVSMLARIDDALAEHKAEERVDSATPVVEWETDAFGNDYVKQGNVLSMVAQTLDGNYGWETRTEGYADTEAEAKSAAIAAARGMK